MKTNAAWLENNFFIPKEVLEVTYNCDESSTSTAQKLKPFSQLNCRQKKRRTEALRVGNTPELTFAAKLSMQAAGNKDITAVLSNLIANPEDATRIRAFCEGKTNETQTLYTKQKALAVMISLQLSKLKYIRLREISIEKYGANPYPSYYKVQQDKKDCYPFSRSNKNNRYIG